jgi:hypothetical protein
MHLHVGKNIPGYLPESDIGCFDDLDAAAGYLADELQRIEEDYYEHCPNDTVNPGTEQNCECDWCELAGDVYADRLHDGPTWPHLRTHQAWSAIYHTPEGPDLHVWVQAAEGSQEGCDIRLYQD